MHYLFDRRLNMLDVILYDLSDEELNKGDIENRILEETRIKIPELETDKMKVDVKKQKLNSDNAPKNFHLVKQNEEYEYAVYTVPFSDSEFIDDIFKTGAHQEGLSITPKQIEFKEYSHFKIEGDQEELDRIKGKAMIAVTYVQGRLAEFASDAHTFNSSKLPDEITKRVQAERLRRATIAGTSKEALKFK